MNTRENVGIITASGPCLSIPKGYAEQHRRIKRGIVTPIPLGADGSGGVLLVNAGRKSGAGAAMPRPEAQPAGKPVAETKTGWFRKLAAAIIILFVVAAFLSNAARSSAVIASASPTAADEAKAGRPEEPAQPAVNQDEGNSDKPAADPFALFEAGDYAAAFAPLLERAESDDAETGTLWMVGDMYFDGKGVGRDYDAARRWYEKAAAKGSPEALDALGYMYAYGVGVKADGEKAAGYFRMAIKKDYAKSFFNMGVMFKGGHGILADADMENENFARAELRGVEADTRRDAAKGWSRDQTRLGYMLVMGIITDVDHFQARDWFAKAAAGGFAMAQCNLGHQYMNGNGVEKGLDRAVRWFRQAAEQGYAPAHCMLGTLYCFKGYSSGDDRMEGPDHLLAAASLGLPRAQYLLGIAHLLGIGGVDADEEQGLMWLVESVFRFYEPALKAIMELIGDESNGDPGLIA